MANDTDLIFGKYEIIRRLAVGGMGEIFLANQHGVPGFERLTILKNLLPELANQHRFIDQFLDEARVAAAINHPNIVALYEVGLWQGMYFIAMEYIRGVTVSNLLVDASDKRVVVPAPVAARIVHDVCLGLDHAHHAEHPERGPLQIVHRDVSPQNIMVRDDGVTKIVDFGIAQAAHRSSRTATGDIKGKVAYMSPEQVSGEKLDSRSDLFSLGVVFWELCTRTRLFAGDNAMTTMRKITVDPIPTPSSVVDGFPERLEQVIMKMLSRDREQRHSRCREAAADIRAYVDSISREIGEPDVARFVSELSGYRIDEATSNLSPTGDTPSQNFVLDLTTGEQTIQLTEEVHPSWWRRRSTGAVLVLAAAAALLVAIWQPWGAEPTDERPLVEEHETPVEPTAVATVLELTSAPSGASVRVGDLVLGDTPIVLDSLSAGSSHTLTISKRGFQVQEVAVRLETGESITKHVKLEPVVEKPPITQPRPPRTGGTGSLTVSTKPWAMVHVGGRVFEAPFANKALPAGKHTLRFVNMESGIDTSCHVIIKGDELTKLKIDFSKTRQLGGTCPHRR